MDAKIKNAPGVALMLQFKSPWATSNEETRAALANRPARLDDAKIAAHAQEMGEFLMQSELTETKSLHPVFRKGSSGRPK